MLTLDGATVDTFDINGHDQSLAALDSANGGNAVVTNGAGAGTNILTLSGANSGGGTANSNYAGVIQDGANAKIALAVTGGSHAFTGANTFSAGTTLSGGSLLVGNATALGGGAVNVSGGTLGATNGVHVINVATNYTQSGGTLSIQHQQPAVRQPGRDRHQRRPQIGCSRRSPTRRLACGHLHSVRRIHADGGPDV